MAPRRHAADHARAMDREPLTAPDRVGEADSPALSEAASPRSLPLGATERRVRVVIAEDHPMYRDGVVRAIASAAELELVGEAETGDEALLLIEYRDPDVALLDVRMPGIDGIDLCARLAAHDPPLRTRVILLSAYLDPALVSRAVRAGAFGYLGKDASRDEICDALVAVGRGRAIFSPRSTPGLIDGLERIYQGERRG
jgi:two-component system, NarL family, nitrate/nitrite response regulator NarL